MTTQTAPVQFTLESLHQMAQENQEAQAVGFTNTYLAFRVEPQQYRNEQKELVTETYKDGTPKTRLVVDKMTQNGKFTSDQYNGLPNGANPLSHMSQIYSFLEYGLTNIGPLNQVSDSPGWQALVDNMNASWVGAQVQEKKLTNFQPQVGGKAVTISRPKQVNGQDVQGPDGKKVYEEQPVTFKSITLPVAVSGRLSDEDLGIALSRLDQWNAAGRPKQDLVDANGEMVSLKEIASHINGKSLEQAAKFLTMIPPEKVEEKVRDAVMASIQDGSFLAKLEGANMITIQDGVITAR